MKRRGPFIKIRSLLAVLLTAGMLLSVIPFGTAMAAVTQTSLGWRNGANAQVWGNGNYGEYPEGEYWQSQILIENATGVAIDISDFGFILDFWKKSNELNKGAIGVDWCRNFAWSMTPTSYFIAGQTVPKYPYDGTGEAPGTWNTGWNPFTPKVINMPWDPGTDQYVTTEDPLNPAASHFWGGFDLNPPPKMLPAGQSLAIYFEPHLAMTFIWSRGLEGLLTPQVNGVSPLGPVNRSGWTVHWDGAGHYPGSSLHGSIIYSGAKEFQLPSGAVVNGVISGFKYDDKDASGTFTTGDIGINGWPIDLIATIEGIPIEIPTTTDSTGFYQYMELPYATYSVKEAPENGETPPASYGSYLHVFPTNGLISGITLTSANPTDTDNNFFNYGGTPGIAVVKTTNDIDVTAAPGPYIAVGGAVTWKYAVTNTGNVPLSAVSVTDSIAGVNPAYVSGDTNANSKLDLTETWIFSASGTAVAGQYHNTGTAHGTPPVGSAITATDDSWYLGVKAKIELTPLTGTNSVGSPHNITANVTVDTGSGWQPAQDSTPVSFAIVSGPGSLTSSGGTTTGGLVQTTLNSNFTGLTTVNATATLTFGSLNLIVSTGTGEPNSGNAQKQWVNAKISINPPNAMNHLNTNHVLTANVTIDDGSGWAPAPDGTPVNFAITVNPNGATFVGPSSGTTTGGIATATITALLPGTDTISASTTVSVGGISVSRTTDSNAIYGNSGPATKRWINPNTQMTILPYVWETEPGGNAILTISEQNTGDVPLTSANVTLEPVGILLTRESNTVTANFTGGDTGPTPNVLDPGEVWTWEVRIVVSSTTTFIATGHGMDPLMRDITYDTGYTTERASVLVEVGNATRTWGFWKTHLSLVQWMFSNRVTVPINLGTWNGTPMSVDNVCSFMGLMWASQTHNSDGSMRTDLDAARIHTAQQALAAIMNAYMPGGAPLPGGITLESIATTLSGTNIQQIRKLGADLAAYNESGDNEALDPSMPPTGKTNNADPQGARAIGAPCEPYWNTPLEAPKGNKK